MNHVFILGAGASRESGGPLMSDFLDHAEALNRTGPVDNAAFNLVFDGIQKLQVAHSKASLDINNVETVMAAFEMARLFERLGDLPTEIVSKLPSAITTLVAQTVEELVKFDMRADDVVAPPSYAAFSNLLRSLRRCQEHVSVLTFNYDLGADLAISRLNYGVAYGLPGEEATERAVPLLKLHGSLAWATDRLQEKNEIVAVPVHEICRYYLASTPPDERVGSKPLRIRQLLKTYKAVQGQNREPVIVPPTWAKTAMYASISCVWKRAADALKDAENIYVMGYSLPPADEFFRLLYALGSAGRTRIKRFWVYDPNKEIEGRFRSLLGQAAESRFEFHPMNFSDAVGALARTLREQEVVHAVSDVGVADERLPRR
jgi:hypothetical protein